MPNWCNNHLSVLSNNRFELDRFKKEAKSRPEDRCEETMISLRKLYPCPKEHEENSYEWNNLNWGTKWDIEANLLHSTQTKLEYTFDSAYNPPIEAFGHIAKNYPDLTFILVYDELSNGFAGTAHIDSQGIVDTADEIEEGFCLNCQAKNYVLREVCCNCGEEVDKSMISIGNILEHSNIVRTKFTNENNLNSSE